MRLATIMVLATRYTFAQGGRRYLSTFLSSLSMLGLVLAVALLIAVLSVMNGFDREMRQRILTLVPHITLYARTALPADDLPLIEKIHRHPAVERVYPFVRFNGLLMQQTGLETAAVVGVKPAILGSTMASVVSVDQQATFATDPRSIILGRGLAAQAGLSVGDRFTLIVPSPQGIDSRTAPRFQTLTVAGLMNSGTELDQSAAFVHIELASDLAGLNGGITGYQVFTSAVFEAPTLAWQLLQNLPTEFYAVNWTMTHGNLYAAIQMSRTLVTLLLFSIIAVAAFNVVSSLVLVVFDKQGDIAILRTMGTTPAAIAQVFLAQGAMIGLVGVVAGSALGALLAIALPETVSVFEAILGTQFLNTDVYPVSFLPSQLLWRDVLLVGSVAWGMCLLSALYPARRAARLAPAVILHQE